MNQTLRRRGQTVPTSSARSPSWVTPPDPVVPGPAPPHGPSRQAGSLAFGTPAVVIGSGLGALGALRLLGRAGVPVYSLNGVPSFESKSRWHRPLPGVH